MKWIAKRILVKSPGDMDLALTNFVIPFIEKMKRDEGISDWYCSRKSDDGIPSVRIYLKVDLSKGDSIQSKLHSILKDKGDQIGWTGGYFQPDPEVHPSKHELKTIQGACEIALELMKKYPQPDRHQSTEFVKDLREAVSAFVLLMQPNYDWEAVHFISNNLGLNDEAIFQLARAAITSGS